VSFNCCAFAVQGVSAGDRPLLEHRLTALERFYAPLGRTRVCSRHDSRLSLLFGAVSFGDPAPREGAPIVWGGPLPEGLTASAQLVHASDEALRKLDGVVAAIGVDEQPDGRILTGAGGVTSLYTASSRGLTAWATHAVAAAWLATGSASLDAWAIPELLARGFVGGDRTLIEGASAVPAATSIELTPGGVNRRSYWPAEERWAPVPEESAYELAVGALRDGLRRRLSGCGSPYLGLTGGLDSRVVAIVLGELGIDFGTYTWGEEDWSDVIEARRVAELLGLPHQRQPIEIRGNDVALGLVDADARWTDGVTAARFMAQTWPEGMDVAIAGMGGETGRAFYYDARVAHAFPAPSPRDLHRFFDARGRIHGASREAVRELRAAERSWVDAAARTGATGWRCLDIVYAEQRVRRWGRAMLPQTSAAFVPAFATSDVSRALTSMPLASRLTDGFHRRLLSRVPELSPPPAATYAPPPALRRIVAGLPGVRQTASLLRRGRPPGVGPWYRRDMWPDQPRLHRWLEDEVLGSALLGETMGNGWLSATRAGFSRGEAMATEAVLLAAAPLALSAAIGTLRADAGGRAGRPASGERALGA